MNEYNDTDRLLEREVIGCLTIAAVIGISFFSLVRCVSNYVQNIS